MAITPEKLAKYFKLKLAAEISPRGLKSIQESKEKVNLVDVRMPEDYKAGHVPGAVNIPYCELEKQYKTINKKYRTFVYCSDFACFAAPKAALFLAKKGYYVTQMVGGFATYKEKGLPVKSATPKTEKMLKEVAPAEPVVA